MSCSSDEDCSDQICGRTYASDDAPKKCCSSGIYGGWYVGMVCESSALSGQGCSGEDEICQSGICVLDTCMDGKQEGDELCGTESYKPSDEHCLSGKCGRKEALNDSPNVCCPSGETVYTGYATGFVCTGRLPGAACADEPLVCQSGVCSVDGICLNAKLPEGEACFNDDACANGSCGFSSEAPNSEKICCPSGSHFELHGVPPKNVCTGLPIGSNCGSSEDGNALCASNLCQNEKCVEKPGGEESIDELPSPKALGRTVLCDDGVTVGYNTIFDVNAESNSNSDQTFVLCPGITFDLANEQKSLYFDGRTLDLRSNMIIQCGDDGSSKNKCILKGNNLQASILSGQTMFSLKGITFESSWHKSIETDLAGVSSKIRFEDCHWNYNDGGSGWTKYYPRSTINVDNDASFESCSFNYNEPSKSLISVSSSGRAIFVDCVFNRNMPMEYLIDVEAGGSLVLENNCFSENVVQNFGMIGSSVGASFQSFQNAQVGNTAAHGCSNGVAMFTSHSQADCDAMEEVGSCDSTQWRDYSNPSPITHATKSTTPLSSPTTNVFSTSSTSAAVKAVAVSRFAKSATHGILAMVLFVTFSFLEM